MMKVDLTVRPFLSDLQFVEPRVGGAGLEAAELEASRRARRSPPERFQGRAGYDVDFLGFPIPLPDPAKFNRDVLEIEGSPENRLDYEHFSVVMSKSRRMPMFVGVNIDGEAAVRVVRSPPDKWFYDGRIPDEAQIGEELYADNILDRGHLVRREDPNWGETAETANDDTFHFTNCTPQASHFNQQTWLSLENYILKNAKAQEAKVNVFSGPIFRDNDRLYRGVKIPVAYWKVISFVSNDGKPSSTAYTIDQVQELKELEAVFGAFKTYQRSVRSIEKMTGLSFGQLRDYDGFSNEEQRTRTSIVAEVRDASDMRV
ncbi:DNA/RNA non-specific endonuclease [Bradyrhizobium nanningense]|uniref:DNA/RNA non-specific endonuclease n=1 Tax=Bradyrhizobium nanningense TaxID=1325118 RepID=UPI001ABF23C4|nr:DNA/RNA non-specific endonuclease [Bradyrhizobium nanningense]